MFEVGIYEAKAHLAEILRRVEKGESCTITRRGKPVGKVVPVEPDKDAIRAQWDRIIALREKNRKNKNLPSWKELYDLRHEGHKW